MVLVDEDLASSVRLAKSAGVGHGGASCGTFPAQFLFCYDVSRPVEGLASFDALNEKNIKKIKSYLIFFVSY